MGNSHNISHLYAYLVCGDRMTLYRNLGDFNPWPHNDLYSWWFLVIHSVVMKYYSYQLTRNPTRNDHSFWIPGRFLLEWEAPGMTILSQYWLVKIPGRNGRILGGSYQEQGVSVKTSKGVGKREHQHQDSSNSGDEYTPSGTMAKPSTSHTSVPLTAHPSSTITTSTVPVTSYMVPLMVWKSGCCPGGF